MSILNFSAEKKLVFSFKAKGEVWFDLKGRPLANFKADFPQWKEKEQGELALLTLMLSLQELYDEYADENSVLDDTLVECRVQITISDQVEIKSWWIP